MKTKSYLSLSTLLLVTCLCAVSTSSAEFKKRQKVWSKHYETPLLSEPKPLASVEATIGFGEKLSIREVRGTWLKVKSDDEEGWVFQGNVASDKPKLAPDAGWSKIDAAQTDTVAAARPLAPAAENYAERNNAGEAKADIDWLDAKADAVSEEQIVFYMSENQIGEYQE